MKMVSNEEQRNMRVITIDKENPDEAIMRIVVIVDKDTTVKFDRLDGDVNKIIVSATPKA